MDGRFGHEENAMKLLGTQPVWEPVGKVEAIERDCMVVGWAAAVAEELAERLPTWLDNRHTAAVVNSKPTMSYWVHEQTGAKAA